MTSGAGDAAPGSHRSRPAPSIRRRLGAVLATMGVLVAALFVVTTLQLRASSAQTRAENERNTSFRLADSMRQSSNDLSLMVRLYVSTGEARYRRYYDEILDIRAAPLLGPSATLRHPQEASGLFHVFAPRIPMSDARLARPAETMARGSSCRHSCRERR